MKRRLTRDAFKLHSVTICVLKGEACIDDCRKCPTAQKHMKELKREDKK